MRSDNIKVLIVTEQIVEIKGKDTYCIGNFFDIIKNFSFLGEISICCQKYDGTNSHNIVDTKLTELVPPNRVKFIEKERIFPKRKNTNILIQEIQKNDIIIGYVPSVIARRSLKIAHRYDKMYLAYMVACTWDALWNHSIPGKVFAPISFLLTKLALKKTDYALYVTERFLQKRYPTKSFYIGCSDVKISSIQDQTLKERLDFIEKSNIENKVNIVTVAALDVKYKGQEYVIKAISTLKKRGVTKFHYYLIGGGDQGRLKNLIKKLDVEENVHIIGKVSHNNLFGYLDKMHVYIQPSLQEGLPRSVVEAMSRGLLCIGAKTAAIPDLLDPSYVVNRKSVEDIVKVLASIDRQALKLQAEKNFKESKNYQVDVLKKKREILFDKIKKDMELQDEDNEKRNNE